jgi:hypothetical protein
MALSDRDRRTLIIGGVVLGVILVGYLLFTMLSGGGGSATPSFAPVSPGSTGSSPSASGSPSLAPSVQPAQTFTGRDPFSIPPVLVTTSPPQTTGPSGSGSGTPPPSSGSSTPSTSPPPTNPGGGSSTVVGGHTVVLLDVFPQNGTDTAQVEVDGQVYNVSVGNTFAGRFELVSTSGNCADFLYGDQSFTLCASTSK